MAWRAERGSQRPPKASKKGPQNEWKFVKNPPRHSLACPGVSGGTPPGASRPPVMHIYAYLCIYSCILSIFMHIYAYILHIYAYLDTYMYILCIFMHICVNVMHIYAYLCIFTHICAYLCIACLRTPFHTKTWIYCWWKNVQQGYTPQGVEVNASILNIHLSCIVTGTINIHSDAVPELPHGTAVGSALRAFRYSFIDVSRFWAKLL